MDSAALSWYLRSLCIAVDFHFCVNALSKNGDFPCRGVWCLFEFFLSSRQHLDLVFVTNAGVVGDAAWRKWFVLKGLEPSNHLLFFWKKQCWIVTVTANVAGKFLLLHEHECSSVLQDKANKLARVTFAFKWTCASKKRGLTVCKRTKRPTASIFCNYAVNSPPARLS